MKVYDLFGVMPARRRKSEIGDASSRIACPIAAAPGFYQLRSGAAPYAPLSANAFMEGQLSGMEAVAVGADDPRCIADGTPAQFICPTGSGTAATFDLKTGAKLTVDTPGTPQDNPVCPGYAARQNPAPIPQPQPPPPEGTPVIIIRQPYPQPYPGYPPPGYYPPVPVPPPAAAAQAPAPTAAVAVSEPSSNIDTVALVSGVGGLGLVAAIAAGVFGK